MKNMDLFVGITTWNSESFIGHCVSSIMKSTADLKCHIVVLDNNSTDKTTEIAAEAGAYVQIQRCAQGDALNTLVSQSDARFTLLVHSDVVILANDWFTECVKELDSKTILVSPEDIGCGPYSRPFGKGMPESSFLFFDTELFKKTHLVNWRKRFGLPLPRRVIDFFGPHITHNLPERLRQNGFGWKAMNVLISPTTESPIYQPAFTPDIWTDELAFLRYGLGNFYSLNGKITHYHNWYDRIDMNVDASSIKTVGKEGKGFPAAYIKAYTDNFLKDYSQNNLRLPLSIPPQRVPVAL